MLTVTAESGCGELLLSELKRMPKAFLGGACHADEVPSRLPVAEAMIAAERASWMKTLERFMVYFVLCLGWEGRFMM